MSSLSDRAARRAATPANTDTQASPAEASVGVQPRTLSVSEAEATYETARAAWLDALRSSASGSNRALAQLALAQEAYEAAGAALELARAQELLEQQRLEAVRQRREEINRRAQAIAGQAAAWDRVHEEGPRRRGLLGRLFKRD